MAKSSGTAAAAAPELYVALVGLNYPTAKGEMRAEAGDVMPDPAKGLPALPDSSIPWLLESGAIAAAETKEG